MRQFPLPLKFDQSATFDNFFLRGNELTLAALRAQQVSDGWLYIHGHIASGVSHLLQACCNSATSKHVQNLYLDLAEMPGVTSADSTGTAGAPVIAADLFEGLENYDLLCLDNVDALANNKTWQEALFYLLVKIQQRANTLLVLGAHQPASALQSILPDLRSRLESATSFALCEPDDEAKAEIIMLRANQLGCEMPDTVARFIVQRYSRKLPDLITATIELDRQSISHTRKLTLPFVKQVLSI
ncbi:MAG: hypothetical protein KJP25_02505 [Gammaproteobacteria bacterium]|nr:hypothetical protein [Gammaproteobacteria bacterium]MBT8149895.1 hypothetical protein [Gammaproteobacteria bacterium]NNM10402.1 hypothetical protein [Pseudomonadales bacterium]RZV56070.1 MAG: hypothetical protein EX270_05940 [Pseudomonadales bacterium]